MSVPVGRKPLAVAQSRDPKSIRFCPAEWAAIAEAALLRGLEPSAFARDLCLMGLQVIETPALMEAYVRGLAVTRANGHSISA